jgi:hypothetical protein
MKKNKISLDPKKRLYQKQIDFDGKVIKSLDVICQQLFRAYNSKVIDFTMRLDCFINDMPEGIEVPVPGHPVQVPDELVKKFLQDLFIYYNDQRIIFS